MTQHGVVLFYTTSSVMRAEKLLVKAGLEIKLIPPPREFSSDCGIAARFHWEERDKVKQLLDDEQVEFTAIRLLSR